MCFPKKNKGKKEAITQKKGQYGKGCGNFKEGQNKG